MPKVDRARLAEVATVTVQCYPEDHDPIDSFGYDTPEENERAAREVQNLAERTEWGWCWVKVTAEYAGLTGTDVLGGCSYESREAFERDGYYQDMLAAAIEELAEALEKTARLARLVEQTDPSARETEV